MTVSPFSSASCVNLNASMFGWRTCTQNKSTKLFVHGSTEPKARPSWLYFLMLYHVFGYVMVSRYNIKLISIATVLQSEYAEARLQSMQVQVYRSLSIIVSTSKAHFYVACLDRLQKFNLQSNVQTWRNNVHPEATTILLFSYNFTLFSDLAWQGTSSSSQLHQ